jgi:WD40 repeat protein
MDAPLHCAQCGAVLSVYALEGVCGNCLLQPGLEPMRESVADLAEDAPFPASGSREKGNHFGDYELLEEIARGGMGIVYRARQVSLDRIVAVKMLLAGHLAGKDFVQRFRTEASAAASLQHPNIVAIHEVGFADGQHFFAMDYVEGLTLAQLVAKGPLPATRAATYLKVIAEAIHFAHERNVLHRDLKPSNVIIDSATDQPRVTDFGLAKRLESETELTLSGQLLGSPNYVSPEQAAAKRGTVGKRSDVYSLGAILYHLLTGRPPFQGETLTEVLRQLADNDPLAPRLLTPRVPHDLETICLKCLEKEPAGRYQTAQELADELGRFLRHEPIVARPVTTLEHAWRWYQRKPAIASLSAATLLLLLAIAIGSPIAVFRLRRERERTNQTLYNSNISLAQHTWDEGDLGGTLRALEAHGRKADENEDRRGFEWYYYSNLCRGDPHITIGGHSNAVDCVALSPDGKRAATGSIGNPVRIWETATGKLLKTVPEQNMISLAFAPDGQTLGMGGRDEVVVRNLETERIVFKREGASGQFHLAFSPIGTLLVVGKRDGPEGSSATLWDYVTGERKRDFPDSGAEVVLSPRGDRLATGNWKQHQATTKIWDTASGQLVKVLDTGDIIIALAFSPDGQALATSYWGPEVKLLEVTTGREISSLTNNQRQVWSLVFSPDGSLLATAGADQTVSLWDVATRQRIEKLRGHGSEVVTVAFSTNGQMLASAGKDRTAMIWSVHPDRMVTTVSNTISRAIFSPDSRLVAAGVGENKVVVWDVATLHVQAEFADAHDAVAFSPDGGTIMTRGTNYFLKTFDLATRAAREMTPGQPMNETFFYDVLSPDGQLMATGGSDGTLTFFDAKKGALLASVTNVYSRRFFKMAFSPDGRWLATAGMSELMAPKIWNSATHKMVAAPPGHTELVLDVAFSPHGELLATCGVDDSIKFWDTTTWKEIPPSLGHKEYVSALAFSPDGKTLATACNDGTMKLWNVATRREVASLNLGMYGFYITFSPDGQTLAVQEFGGGSLRLWRAPRTDHP